MKRYFIYIAGFLLLILSYSPIYSQLSSEQGMTLDKIVAIVGEEIIMQSDIDGRLAILKQQNPKIDINDPTLRQKVLDAAINEYLVVSKAIEDSIVVTEEEINEKWEEAKADFIQYYGSLKRVEDIYGMSLSRIQLEHRDIVRKQLLAQKLQYKIFGNVKISPKEVEDFYNLYKDSLGIIPMQMDLYHIVKYTSASAKAKEETYELAKKVRDSIVKGGLFADFAKRYSQDPGSASSGGELGWVAKGKLLPEFEKASFDLLPGQTSMPIETPFGYHLIQTLDKNKDSVLSRHILFRVGQTEDDRKYVIGFLNSIRDSVRNGKDFESLAKIYSEETTSKGFGGYLGKMGLEEVPPNIREIVSKLKEGEISEPLPYNVDPSKPAYHIIYKKKEISEHKADLKEDYKLIEQRALAYKKMKMYEDWTAELRKELYWEIKN